MHRIIIQVLNGFCMSLIGYAFAMFVIVGCIPVNSLAKFVLSTIWVVHVFGVLLPGIHWLWVVRRFIEILAYFCGVSLMVVVGHSATGEIVSRLSHQISFNFPALINTSIALVVLGIMSLLIINKLQ